MDEFFQKLRRIQKKERSESGLARVGDDFYKRVHSYLEELLAGVGSDPFAKEHFLLRDTQRIATEICERREHKITDSAVMNVQRSYHLFNGKPQFDLQDTTPLNMTPEEAELYYSLIKTLRDFRSKIIPSIEVIEPNEDSVMEQLGDEELVKTDKELPQPIPKAKSVDSTDIKTVLIFDEVPVRIMGVNEKVYGPFRPQDVVTLPGANANLFIKAKKGRKISYTRTD